MKELPKKLKAIATLKPGETAVFETLFTKYEPMLKRTIINMSTKVPTLDRIIHPDDALEEINLEYIIKERPGGADDKQETVKTFGDIVFFREHQGQIVLSGNNAADRMKYRYLRLTNYNISNKGEKFHIAPEEYLFRLCEPELDAKAIREKDRLIRQAEDMIDKLDLKELQDLCMGLDMPHHSNADQMSNALRKEAKKSPKRFLEIDKDYKVKFMADITKAVDAQVIKHDSNWWMYSDSEAKICAIAHGRRAKQSMYEFLQTKKGEEVHKKLIELTESKVLEPESK